MKSSEYFYHLNDEPFQLIESGDKTVEMRLFDEKRQKLKVGDVIVFTNKKDETKEIKTKIIAIHKFKNFKELYKEIDKSKLGYKKGENANSNDMSKYYSKEDEEKYGVVGIEIKLI